MRIAVAGGTGTAGRVIAARAAGRGHEVRVVARSTGSDVTTGAGLDAALEGCAAVVDATNLATASGRKATEFWVRGTEHLLAAGRRRGVGHHLVLSIVAVDRFSLGYYRAKLAQEDAVIRGSERQGVPYTIARLGQFHDFAALVVDSYRLGPLVVAPAMHLQPVHLDDVAEHVLDLVEGGPVETAPELIGPQPEELPDMVRRYAATRPDRRVILPMPLPPAARRANEAFVQRPAEARRGTKTFDEWLAEQR